MGEEQQFCLRWNNFQANITSQFEALRDEEDFVDVTLACEGQRIKAHKVVLSACSPYFKELFRSNPCKHPILFMRDVEFRHLQSLIEFMYAGEVNVAQAHLSSFLRTAESLQIRGLTEAPQRHKQDSKSQPDNSPSSNSLIQQLINPRTQSASPKATSPASKSSQEDDDENNDDDDDVLSMSSSLSPPPTKRAREEEESTSQHPASSVAQTPDALQQDVESAYKDASPELFEPKLEAPDYGSDEESKGNFLGLDNSMLDNTFSALQGGLDMLAGPSAQGYTGDPIHDAALAHHQKLHSLDPRPCPICNRMYSNLSNLRQHVRLIHNPQTVACPLCSKPFKTKLYLKRHLMSFHELLWTSAGGGKPIQGPPPYAAPAQAEHGLQAEDKSNFPNASSPPKGKDPVANPQEYFQTPRLYHNPAHNGERPYAPHAGQEISMFPVTQVPKEDGSNYHRTLEKPRYKPDENSFLNNSDYQSRYVSGPIDHGGNDGMGAYVDTNNQKTSAFLASLSLGKSETPVPAYSGPGTPLGSQGVPGSNKPLEYIGSESHMRDQMELNRNNCKQPSHGE